MRADHGTARSRLEDAAAHPGSPNYVLRLYVSGSTPRSVKAIENIIRICKEHLLGHYELQVVDIYQQPHYARQEQIIAAPTLIKQLPLPLRRLIGDLSDEERVLTGLDIVLSSRSALDEELSS